MTATSEALGEGNMCITKVGGGVPIDTYDCPTSTGLGVNGCVGGYKFLNGEPITITVAEGNCNYVDSGRDSSRYNVNLFYSWADSGVITHQLSGELLAGKP